MTVWDLLEVIDCSDKLLIVRDAECENGQETVYTGYKAMLELCAMECAVLDAEVKKFRAFTEIRHKEWQSKRLVPPMEPDRTPDFSFSDLQMTLYYAITI